ncbi:MAG: hypothetical protein LBV51_01820 [Acholeplasmatales bacterium]|jgi:uncharacterized FAD-dependent dehydrogenase|nr:hypothetical protein [Acholeplasmatales bacterium]
MKYDLIIVGAGPAGIFASYEYSLLKSEGKVLLIDKGEDIYERSNKANNKRKSITTGFGGSGAFSDGKYNITSEFGGWLTEYLGIDKTLELIKYVDSINLSHGATTVITDPTTPEVHEIEKKGIAYGLKLLKARVRHLGTEQNLQILISIYEELSKKIDMMFNTEVKDIIVEDGEVKGIIIREDEVILCDNIFLAVGRVGANWLEDICEQHKINMITNQVDIGVRVETNNIIMDDINNNLYEGKFVFNTSVGNLVRTFCSNPSGHVVIEDYKDKKIRLVNGHSYNDKKLGSENTNFALLVSHHFDEPFTRPNDYAAMLGKLANDLACGGVIVQRYGDILKGRRTTAKRLDEGFVRPTLKDAVPGDLGLVLPYNTMKSIIEMIEALDHITPGIANEHTLLYGLETKFYSARPEINNNCETKIKHLYVGGDGAGITRGLAQASANGVWVARAILGVNK